MFHFKKRCFAYFIVGIGVVPLLILGMAHHLSVLFKADFMMTRNIWIFTGLRWFLISIFYVSWPGWVKRNARRHAWTEAKTYYWLQQRGRISAWLICFEIFVCENALWRLLHWM